MQTRGTFPQLSDPQGLSPKATPKPPARDLPRSPVPNVAAGQSMQTRNHGTLAQRRAAAHRKLGGR